MTDKDHSRKKRSKSHGRYKSSAGKLQAVLVSKEFLIFAVIYTANLVANVFTDFSVSKIFFQIFPILFCTGIWMIYCNRYKETMSTSGFSSLM